MDPVRGGLPRRAPRGRRQVVLVVRCFHLIVHQHGGGGGLLVRAVVAVDRHLVVSHVYEFDVLRVKVFFMNKSNIYNGTLFS